MAVEPREELVGEASTQLSAEPDEIKSYLSGHASTVESEPRLGMALSEEFGAVANLSVREEVENLVNQLYDQPIDSKEGEISLEEGIRQTYELLEGYEASDCSPTSVAAGAVRASERFNAWSSYHSQNEIAEAADISSVSLREHSKAIQQNYVDKL